MIRKHENPSRFVDATLQAYSTSFERPLAPLLEEKYLTTKLTDLRAKNFLLYVPEKFAERWRKQPRTRFRAQMHVFYSDPADAGLGLRG